jgi:hypothetical protein
MWCDGKGIFKHIWLLWDRRPYRREGKPSEKHELYGVTRDQETVGRNRVRERQESLLADQLRRRSLDNSGTPQEKARAKCEFNPPG